MNKKSSVLVVFGDHDAGFARSQLAARTIGIGPDDIAWTLNDRIPLFIRLPAASRGTGDLSGVRARPAGQVDVAPTVLALLGIDPAPLPYLGRNLLGLMGDTAVVRPYGDWLDAHHLFLARGPGSVCYDVQRLTPASLSDCRTADEESRRARELSRLVVVDDLQERLRARLASAIR
jgi:lipoteichoic acid synthase